MKRKRVISTLLLFVFGAFTLGGCSNLSGIFPFFAEKENQTTQSQPFSLSVMTWNIYLGHGKGQDAVRAIEEKTPDILHLQEAKNAYDSFVDAFLEIDDDYAILERELTDEVGTIVLSTPILYNKNVVEPIVYGAERLTDAYQGVDTKSVAWAVFRDKATGGMLLDFNFHGAVCGAKYEGYESLTSEQRDQVASTWRKGNVEQVLRKRAELVNTYGDIATIITGDCNFDEDSIAYGLLTNSGYFDAETTAPIATRDGLKSTHDLGKPSKEGKTIDHIFGNGNVTFALHEILRQSYVLAASDHCPVYAEFTAKN